LGPCCDSLIDRQRQNLAEIFTILSFFPKRKTKAERDQFWASPFTRSLGNAESNHASSEDHVAVAALFDTSGITSCRTVSVRPTKAHMVPPSSLHDMRIAPRECLPRLEQMIDPPPPVTRWTSRRKAAVVAAVHSGEITLVAACGWYELSIEEFRAWESKLAPRLALSAVAIDLQNSINPHDDPNLAAKT
jgi:hypothetical protein